ncbi:alpha-hydroxy-acid oxidizing protein [Deinococcus sp.]|uniref:alpha-hydroxy-acid oxidizing protein n=1 Tax=Deinococcus sp. TaxID=47478 RepID=UPI003C7C6EEB
MDDNQTHDQQRSTPTATSFGLARQSQIFLDGLKGVRPTLPVDPAALEQAAQEAMTPEARGYLGGMPGTMRANLDAFADWNIVPRMLRGVQTRDLGTTLFGRRLPAPVLLAPVGVQSIVHPDGERAVARAAAGLGLPMVFSTASSFSLEETAAGMSDAPRWFQLYWSKSAAFNASVVSRAEAAGCGAIVVTLDTFMLAWRPQDLQNAYLPFMRGLGLANYFSDPAFRAELQGPPEQDPQAAVRHFLGLFNNPALTWKDLSWLRERTRLPILLKGILHPDDARRALDCGIDGLVVSNHGGRQVEGAVPALGALPAVVEAVKGRVPVLLDSGVRRASDVIKARALGAQAVLLGRPYLWGLALGGEAGVAEVLGNLLADLDLTLGLSGYSSFDELDASSLVRAGR